VTSFFTHDLHPKSKARVLICLTSKRIKKKTLKQAAFPDIFTLLREKRDFYQLILSVHGLFFPKVGYFWNAGRVKSFDRSAMFKRKGIKFEYKSL